MPLRNIMNITKHNLSQSCYNIILMTLSAQKGAYE